MLTSSMRGTLGGCSASIRAKQENATATPRAPPRSKSKPSVSTCRTTRSGEAPSAVRSAISRRRADPRARTGLPRWSRQSAAQGHAAHEHHQRGPHFAGKASLIVFRETPKPASLVTSSRCRRAAIAFSSACACCRVTLSGRRIKPPNQCTVGEEPIPLFPVNCKGSRVTPCRRRHRSLRASPYDGVGLSIQLY